MFKTNNARGSQRFNDLREAKVDRPAIQKLSLEQIKLIEDSPYLELVEKLELLQLSLGIKLSTEIYFKINPFNDEITKKINVLLLQLPFTFTQESMLRKKKRIFWFQVYLNDAVKLFFTKYSNDLTEYEEGIIYGYPLSAIRAFGGLIESYKDPNEPLYMQYLAGVGSKKYYHEEADYYRKIWERLRKISPQLINQAESTS